MKAALRFSGLLLVMSGVLLAFTLGTAVAAQGGKQIAYVDWQGSYRIVLHDAASKLERVILRQTAEPCCLSFSPDGRWLAFLMSLNDGPPRIGVIPWGGGSPYHPVDSYVTAVRPQWSPDSEWVAFRHQYANPTSVEAHRSERRLRDPQLPDGRDAFPIWSPDGQQVALVSDETISLVPAACLYKADECDAPKQVNTAEQRVSGMPVWSADSSRLAFVAVVNRRSEVFVAAVVCPAVCPEAVAMTTDGQDKRTPVWSPDGRYLAYSGRDGGAYAVFLLEASCAEIQAACSPRRLGPEGNSFAPAWSSDGTEILFTLEAVGTASGRRIGIQSVTVEGIVQSLRDGLFFNPSAVWWYGLGE